MKIFSLFATLYFLCMTSISFAAIIPYTKTISTPSSGSPEVVTGSSAMISMSASPYASVDRFKQGILTFGVNHRYEKAFSTARILIQVKVQRYSNLTVSFPDLPDTIFKMEISYAPNDSLSFQDRHSVMFSGIAKYVVFIQNILIDGVATDILPANLTLKCDLLVDRYVDFTPYVSTLPILNNKEIDQDCDGKMDQLNINWTDIIGAEEYQLEWTYVNNYKTVGELSESELSVDFKYNSTRISTNKTSYSIPLVFDKGYLVFRVRAIGRSTSNLTSVLFGSWSILDGSRILSTLAAGNKYKVLDAFQGSINWQYSATYAEDGKRKDVIGFYDGVLRNRQNVTKINSDNTAIIGETIYDHLGRPTIQVLPTPTDLSECSQSTANTLKYYPNFNKINPSTPYSWVDFDLNNESCTFSPSSMTSIDGASEYYSPSNPNQSDMDAFIPDAQGYPFTQVEYTSDNTGRIKRQSGVGGAFKLGSGKETSYYYGKPDQIQLDRMFGSEVGYSEHYQKNMVVDPNGQVSVSYLDQEGRVIATSLAGTPPPNLIALETATETALITENMIQYNAMKGVHNNRLNIDEHSWTFTQSMLISSPTNLSLKYDLEVSDFTDSCFAPNICFSCVYDLEIKVIDDCGQDFTPENQYGRFTRTGNFTSTGGEINFLTNCVGGSGFNMVDKDTVFISLPLGTYTITKVLTVNEESIDFYVNKYMDTTVNTCIKTLSDFEQDFLENLDFTDCFPEENCDSCLTALGTLQEYISAGTGNQQDYINAREACKIMCQEPQGCEIYYNLLTSDISPDGQYAEYRETSGTINPAFFALSVFNPANRLPRPNSISTSLTWRNPKWFNGVYPLTISGYFEDDSITRSRIYVEVQRNGVGTIIGTTPAITSLGLLQLDASSGKYFVYPEELSDIIDFVMEWKESWGNSLIYLHPEFEYYRSCLNFDLKKQVGSNQTSNSFDALLVSTNTWDEAVTNGFIKSAWAGTAPNDRLTNWFATSPTLPWDPFVVYSSSTEYNNFGANITPQFNTNYQGTGLKVIQLAALMARSGNAIYGSTPNTSYAEFGQDYFSSPTPAQVVINDSIRDLEWDNLRSLYLSIKQKVQYDYYTNRVLNIVNKGYNKGIGKASFNPFENNFYYFVYAPPLTNAQLILQFFTMKFFNGEHPSSFWTKSLYLHKVVRFNAPLGEAELAMAGSVSQQQTGSSPISTALQGFLTEVAASNKLDDVSFSASAMNSYGVLHFQLNNQNFSISVPSTNWNQVTMNASTLAADLVTSGQPNRRITLQKTSTAFTWDDITEFTNLTYLSTDGFGNKLFTLRAQVNNGNSVVYYDITGSTELNIINIVPPILCDPSIMASDLSMLLHSIAYGGSIASSTGVELLSSSPYANFMTTEIKNASSAGNPGSIKFKYNSSIPGFEIYETNTTTKKLELKILETNPTGSLTNLSSVYGFRNLVSLGGNEFWIDALNASQNYSFKMRIALNTFTGTTRTELASGTCAAPSFPACSNPAYSNADYLIQLIRNTAQNQPLNALNVFQSPLISGVFISSFPATVTHSISSSTSVPITDPFFDQQVVIDIIDVDIYGETSTYCTIKLDAKGYKISDMFHPSAVISPAVAQGTPDANGMYTKFYFIWAIGGISDTVFVEQNCIPVKFCPDSIQTVQPVVMPVEVFTNPCVEMLINAALGNAHNAYQQYKDSVQTSIAQRYIKHCMDAVKETFIKSYTDNEYHRTLYYYDQAGNLIKTVPPQGVNMLAFTSSSDADAIKVANDRTLGTQTIFTNHQMATKYVYNSLNQLTKQLVPDHDAFSQFEMIMPNGLQAGLHVSAIQMLSESSGYLSGYLTSSGFDRGYLYRTTDGGTTWKRVSNTIGSDLKKLQMVSTTVGFAVGNNGTILKTSDGGTSWDLLNTYAISVTEHFNDLHFSSVSEGRFVGINGKVVKTTNGAATLTSHTMALPAEFSLAEIKDIHSVTYFGSKYRYSTTLKLNGQEFDIIARIDSDVASTWEPLIGGDLHGVNYYSKTEGIAFGDDGKLYKIVTNTSGTHIQTLLESGTNFQIQKAFFFNNQIGVALMKTGNDSKLFSTTNGGKNWNELESAFVFNDLQLITRTPNLLELSSVGSHGNMRRILLNNSNVVVANHTNLVNPQPSLLNCSHVVTNGMMQTMLVGADDGKIYFSSVYYLGVEPLALTNPAAWILPIGKKPKELLATQFSNGNISGLVLTTDGNIYSFYKNGSTYVLNGTALITTSGTKVEDLEMNENTIFAFDNVSLRTYRFLLTNASPFYTMTVLNNTTTFATPYPVVKGLSVTSIGLLTFVAQNGEMQTTTTSVLSGTTVAWKTRSNLRSVGINDLHAVTTASGVAAGNNGLLAQFNGTYWYTYKTSTTNNLHAVKSISATNLVVAGAKGHLFSYEIGVNYLTSKAILPKGALLTNGQQSNQFISSDLMDVVVSANAIYSVGKNGVILYGENLFNAPFKFKTNYGGVDFNSVYAISPQNVLVAGSSSKLYRFQGVNGTEIKQVFGNKLNDVHFASANVGTIGGDNFFVRQTLDGGNTWKVVLSKTNAAHLTKNVKRVWTWNNGYAILGGESYFTSVYQQLPGTITSTYSIQDIQFPKSSPLNGYITHNGNLVRLILTPHLIAGYTLAPTLLSAAFGGNIQAIHVFQNKTVMAVGASNLIKYYKPTTNSWTSYTSGAVAGGDYRDVFFHDDKVGYVVGTNGVMLRSQSAVINSAQEIMAISWGSKDINTPDQIISSSSQVGVISAIAFGSRYDGVMGGRYSAANPTLGNTSYVRKINDEAGDFSSKFYYDRLGRLVVSQNSRQKTENKFSYTLYDVLGRVTEAGEKDENTSLKFNSVFGTLVNQQYIPTVIDDTKLSNWLVNSTGARGEVTRSYYDQTVIGGTPMTWNPQTQRKRIVHVTYEEKGDNYDETFDHATHYNYDIHGNVKTLLQENRKMVVEDPQMDGQEIKRMDYSFDLVSGNVNRVSYQHGKADQFHHVYSYDADNRIREVFTTETTPLTSDQYGSSSLKGEPALTPYWHKDAAYSYYQHGPLARTELGGQNVQGIDYIYTIQGWLKGVNSTDLSTERSYKKDGVQTEFAKDVYSYGLHYFENDYFPINTNYQSTPKMPFAAQPLESFLNQNSSDLYNGNIARMVTTITDPTTRSALVLGNAYRYDQLNRIKNSMSNVDAYDKAKYEWQPEGKSIYDNSFEYDANGNILTQRRYDENQDPVDDLLYSYESGINRLKGVKDVSVDETKFSDDIDNSEYSYDAEGRLMSDSQEDIENIKWRVDGKVKVILRGGSIPNQKNIIFDYDAMGNRIAKHIFTDEFNLEKSTYYVLDAQGNVMATYDKEIDYANSSVYLKLKDRSIYGSSRVGVRSTDIDMLALHNPNYSMKSVKYEIGKRTYELSNHLGNVLSVISDKPIPSFEEGNLVGMLADVRIAQDYSPFGVTLSGRDYTLEGAEKGKFGFQNQEVDNEIKGNGNSVNFKYRMHDPRLGRFFAVDPLAYSYPYNSPYAFSENVVINAVELEGLEKKTVANYYETKLDGSLVVKQTYVHIQKDFVRVINGKNYAITHEKIYVDGQFKGMTTTKEEIVKGGMKPAAGYDYTQSVIDGKFTEDWEYIGTNPLNFGDLYSRDVSSPDNRRTLESLEALEATALPIIGKGARDKPKDLQEKLTLDEAKSGQGEKWTKSLGNKKYDPKTGTHDKYKHNHDHGETSTEVHYDIDRKTGKGSGYKIKDNTNKKSRGGMYGEQTGQGTQKK